MRVLKWISGSAAVALAGALAVVASNGQAAGTAGITMTPSTQAVAPGELATLEVAIEDVTGLGTWEVRVEWDPAVLRYNAAIAGSFLASGGASIFCPAPAIGEGYVQFGCNTKAVGVGGVDGSGPLGTVRLEAIAAGSSDIVFTRIELGDVLANTAITPSNFDTAVIQVQAPGEPTQAPQATSTPNRRRLTPTPPPNAPTQTPSCSLTDQAACADPFGGSAGSGSASPTATAPAGTIAVETPVAGGTVAGAGTQPRSSAGSTGSTQGVGSAAGARAQGGRGAPVAGYGPQDEKDPRPIQAAVIAMAAGAVLAAIGIGARARAGARR